MAEDREWVLNCLLSGKAIIPYEMIIKFGSLDIAQKNDVFYLLRHFYSCLKNTIIPREDYDAVKNYIKR